MLVLSITLFNLIKFLNKWLDYKYQQLMVTKYEIDMNLEVTDKIDEMMDSIIESAFQEYSLMHLIYKSDWYITEKEEIEIRKDIAHLVVERMSPIMMQKFSLYYNEEAIVDVISKKVTFRVTNFVIQHNKDTGI